MLRPRGEPKSLCRRREKRGERGEERGMACWGSTAKKILIKKVKGNWMNRRRKNLSSWSHGENRIGDEREEKNWKRAK